MNLTKMRRQDYSQLELFSQTRDYKRTDLKSPRSLFFNYLWNYEKVILIIIVMMITGIVSFSLGVEKGKKLAISTINNQIIDKQRYQYIPSGTESGGIARQKVEPTTIEKQEINKQPASKDSQQYYTIQLASYKTKVSAQKEVEALRKKGFLPLILSKGSYTVVCVGNFSNQKAAMALVSELKKQKRYQDCLIRRL